MEKHYLQGKAKVRGYIQDMDIVFDDVKNLQETKDESGKVTHLEFDDKDGHYSYTLERGVYVEDNDRAPDLISYKDMCRRTAVKKDLVGDDRIEMKPETWEKRVYLPHIGDDVEIVDVDAEDIEPEDDEDEEDDE